MRKKIRLRGDLAKKVECEDDEDSDVSSRILCDVSN